VDPAKFDCRATASVLRSGASLEAASHVGVLLLLLPPVPVRDRVSLLVLASFLCWILAVYFALRVRLDASLFELLAEDPERGPAQLDAFLSRILHKSPKSRGDLPERQQGGIRLWRNLTGTVVLQLGLLAFAKLQ
jgi:hypothetical protein